MANSFSEILKRVVLNWNTLLYLILLVAFVGFLVYTILKQKTLVRKSDKFGLFMLMLIVGVAIWATEPDKMEPVVIYAYLVLLGIPLIASVVIVESVAEIQFEMVKRSKDAIGASAIVQIITSSIAFALFVWIAIYIIPLFNDDFFDEQEILKIDLNLQFFAIILLFVAVFLIISYQIFTRIHKFTFIVAVAYFGVVILMLVFTAQNSVFLIPKILSIIDFIILALYFMYRGLPSNR